MNQAQAYVASVDPRVVDTFRALVEAIVPDGPAYEGAGTLQSIGAVGLHVHEYMIWSLDHSLSLHSGLSLTVFPLAAATAALLQAGAAQLIASGRAYCPGPIATPEAPFAFLAPVDRIRTLAALERLEVDLGCLPPPFKDDGGYLKFMVDYLCHGTMFGDYSEWSAYGTTRLDSPAHRRLEYFPLSWAQVGYPGAVKGYRAFGGYLAYIDHSNGGAITHV
jgi:hypothetical protein